MTTGRTPQFASFLISIPFCLLRSILGEPNRKSWNSCGLNLVFCIHFSLIYIPRGSYSPRCCQNIGQIKTHRFIFVFILYCFYHSSCLKDQFTVLSLMYVLRYSSHASIFSAPFWIIELRYLRHMRKWKSRNSWRVVLLKIRGAMCTCITLVPIKVKNMMQLCQKHRVIWLRQMNELWSFRSEFYRWAGDSALAFDSS